MSLWRQLTHGLRVLLKRDAADRDVGDEFQHYLEEATAAHQARGLSLDEARRAARLEAGSVTGVREEIRRAGWEHIVETFFTDLRYGARRLRAAPGFTAMTVATLAVGIGATTAIFSAVRPILFEPLPYPHADRIAEILEVGGNGSRSNGTFGMFHELAARTRSFESLAVLKPWQPTGTGADRPERFEGQRVSAAYFQVLGVTATLGRDFDPGDDRPGGPNVVILSDALWRRRFGADPAIIGRSITLDDAPHTVIAVMPAGFENVLAPAAELWAPLQYDMSQGRAWGHHLRTIGRLRPGVGIEQAAGEIAGLGRGILGERHPATYDSATAFRVASLRDEVTRGIKPALLVMLGAVLMVLVIACVNVANLLIARGVQRRGEFALRAAIGAGRGRLVRQLLTESLLLAAIGGALGMVVAVLGVHGLVSLAPPGLPRAGAIRVDRTVLGFGVLISTIIGLAFGLIPALQAAHSDPHQALQRGSRRQSGGHQRTRGALVVAEVALALVLLVGSGLLLRSLEQLFAVPVGFDSHGLLTMQVQAVGQRFTDDGTTRRYFDQVLEAVRGVPGVTTAGLTSQLPLSGDRDEYGARFAATPERAEATFGVFRYGVSPGYLETIHAPLPRGRAFEPRDGVDAPPVALISASLARQRFQSQDPVGQTLRVGPNGPYTIIGVVGDVKQLSLALDGTDAVYLAASQWPFTDRAMSLVVRARGDAAALAPAIREAIWSVDRDQPILRVATMDHLLEATAAERRFALVLFGAFGLTALLLAAAGIYGVLSGSVAERTREIGVRAALGASQRAVTGLVLRQGMTLTALGLGIGLIGALIASEAMVTMLFGVSRLDPPTYIGVVLLLLGVAAVACWVPAARAARVDPAITLRSE